MEESCPSIWRTAVRRDGEALSAYEEFLLSLDTIHNPEIETLQRVASVLDIEFDLKISQRQEPTLSSRSSAKAASRSSHSRALETGVRDSGNLPKAATG